MTKRCICQICTCGRHKCPHNPRGIGYGNAPCTFSEYTNKYTPHPIEMRKSCKPEEKPIAGQGPLEDKTTHRVDYIPHPLDKHYVHQGEKYRPPEGDMDMMTNYTKEYTKKPFEPVKLVRPEEARKISGKFEGEPTYTADYRKWGTQPRERHTADNSYHPPSAPFEGNSNYQTDYIPHRGGPRQSMKPNEMPKVSDQPFEDATDYRESYIKHALPPREVKEKTIWQPNTARLDDLSNYRKDYTPKDAGKQLSCKPDATPYRSTAPFESGTTQRADFVEWPTERVHLHEREKYQKPEGDMEMNTTTHTDYTRKPLERQLPLRPQDSRRLPGKFDGTTNYQVEYRKWTPERLQPTMKEQYTPNTAPFEGMPTYQRDYIQHPMSMTRSLKPADLGYSSNAPLEDGTEYRQEYTRKQVSPCPAILIQAGSAPEYTFREQDEVGHKWYELSGRLIKT